MSKRPTMSAAMRKQLNELRKDVKEYGIRAAARDAEVTPAKLSRWVAGIHAYELRVDELERLCGVLGWSVELWELEGG